jgi:sec-independent protein translocase protein TatB
MELLVCAVVALIVFGPEKLPDMARNAGRFLNDLRRMSTEVRSEVQDAFNPNPGDDGFEAAEESQTEASKADESEAGSTAELPKKSEPATKDEPDARVSETETPPPTEYPQRRPKTAASEDE